MINKKIKVAIISSGLGHVFRGFEVSAVEWFKALSESKEIAVALFSGGDYPFAKKVFNIPRDGRISKLLRRLKIINDGVRLEQLSFGVGFLICLLFYKPDIIWLQEISLGETLLKARKLFGFHSKIIFCDGAPVGYKLANQFDHIIFLHSYAYKEAIENGIPSDKCTVIPYVRDIPHSIPKRQARQHFDLPDDKFIVICVAAWNRHHKRIDYLLDEVSMLNDSNILLLLCGQPEQESEELKKLARLKSVQTLWFTLNQDDLSIAYDAADLFVLPSLKEGLGAVIIEAGLHGLPIICHPHAGGNYILGETYLGLTDLSIAENLAKKIKELRSEPLSELGKETKTIVLKEFDKKNLLKRFESFAQKIVSR